MGITSLQGNNSLTANIPDYDDGRWQADFGWGNSVLNDVVKNGETIDIGSPVTTSSVTDSIVVSSAYDTSGNGGRKLARLKNGWLVSTVWSSNIHYFYVSKNNGQTWSQLCHAQSASNFDSPACSIVSDKNSIHIILTSLGSSIITWKVDVELVENKNLALGGLGIREQTIEINQTSLGNVSLAINEQGTELHACWASKNSTYPNSFNIRYTKGTINADGSVTWVNAINKTSYATSGEECRNPTIVLDSSNKPVVLFDHVQLNNNWIGRVISNGNLAIVYNGVTHSQASPSAIFVPKSVNGLTNGRIWVAWEGRDSSFVSNPQIRVSYSDDSGVTWSSMQRLTAFGSNQMSSSITFNKNNEIFIVWSGIVDNYYDLRMIKNSNDEWGSITDIKTSSVNSFFYPNALPYEPSLISPLFIYKDSLSNKVGFYGTWKDGVMSGTITKTVKPADIRQWGNAKWSQSLASGTNIVCDVLDSNDVVIKANIKSLEELNSLGAISTIKLRWTLTRTNESDLTPTLFDPSVTWEGEDILVDDVTGKKYKLVLDKEELFLEEV